MLKSLDRRALAVSLTGRAVSAFGDGIALIALTLRLQADGARPFEVGLLLAAGVIPQLVLAGPIGRLVDGHDSRLLLVAGSGLAAAVTVPLVVLHSFVAIVLLAAALGAAGAVTSTTWTALVPRIVGEDRLARAVSAQQSLNLLALVGAPAIGGLLTGTFGPGVPLTIDVASFLVMTAAALVIPVRRAPAPDSRAHVTDPALGGLAILRGDPVLAPLVAGVAFVILLVGVVDVVLVYLIRDTLHATSVWYGLVETAWVTGMVAGSVAAGAIAIETRQIQATIAGAALACAATLAFAAAPVVWTLLPLSILGGIGNGAAAVCASTLLMTRTDEHARGRVSAAAGAILGGAQGASLLLGGAVAIVLSPRAMYAVGGLLGLVAAGTLTLTVTQRTREPLLRLTPSRPDRAARPPRGDHTSPTTNKGQPEPSSASLRSP